MTFKDTTYILYVIVFFLIFWNNYNMNDNDPVMFNLKLRRCVRKQFREKVKTFHNKSMQNILSDFVESYIENPEQFSIKLGVTNDGAPIREIDAG